VPEVLLSLPELVQIHSLPVTQVKPNVLLINAKLVTIPNVQLEIVNLVISLWVKCVVLLVSIVLLVVETVTV